MTFGGSYFLVLFFAIFHILGGLALGKGIREKMNDAKWGSGLIVWGLIMGVPPILFDWFFLMRVGEPILGLIGPVFFFIATFVGGIFFNGELSRKNEKSIVSILMGGTASMLGLMLTPYLLQQAQTRDDLGIVDYICGGAIPLMFIFIGVSFARNRLTAVSKNMTFDDLIAERQKKAGLEPEEDE